MLVELLSLHPEGDRSLDLVENTKPAKKTPKNEIRKKKKKKAKAPNYYGMIR
jgi:hypothetical protein